MPAVNQGAEDASEDWSVERALLLLERALQIIDHWADTPAIGARLQEVIESIQDLDTPDRARRVDGDQERIQ
jgi:hypothetical protein